MPKFTQTLLAGQYTLADFSNTLKTAMDALGWGTGKVDIAGGYRFTATDEANSNTTPLVLSTFLDSLHGNYVTPILPIEGTGDPAYVTNIFNLAAYLPGVKDFRVKYTLLTIDEAVTPTGTVVPNPITNGRTLEIRPYFLSAEKLISQRDQVSPGTLLEKVIVSGNGVPETSLTVGNTDYSSWTSSFGADTIAGNTGCAFRLMYSLATAALILRIDAIEYKVSQSKFAFQSPNLDSPTMEIIISEDSGALSTFVSPILLKNSNIPVARLGIQLGFNGKQNYQDATPVVGWAKVLFGQNVRQSDNASFGDPSNPMAHEALTVGYNRSLDLQIYVGSSTDFKGFFLTAKNTNSTNTVLFDTVDKSSGYPLSVASKPQGRVSKLSNTQVIKPGLTNIASDLGIQKGGELFFIRNSVKLEAITIGTLLRHHYPYTVPLTLKATIYQVTKDGQDYKLGEVLGRYSSTYKMGAASSEEYYLTVPTNLNIAAGTYLFVDLSGSLYPINSSALAETSASTASYSTGSSRLVEGTYLGSVGTTPTRLGVNPILGNIRYIRDTIQKVQGGQWIEIEALDENGTNKALNKSVTGAGEYTPNSSITNGVKTSANGWSGASGGVVNSVTVDLGTPFDIRTVRIWRHWNESNVINLYKTEVSADNITWYAISAYDLNGTYVETSAGKSMSTQQTLIPLTIGETLVTQGGVPTVNKVSGGTYTPVFLDLTLSSTETPTRNIQFFAENWVSVSSLSAWQTSGHFSTQSSIINNTNRYQKTQGRVLGGIDPAMTRRWRETCLNYHIPGSTQGHIGADDSPRDTTEFNIGFVGSAVKFGGRPMMQAWLYRKAGVPLKYNNLFMWFGAKTVNTSFTAPNGQEFFITHIGEGTSLAFRLKP